MGYINAIVRGPTGAASSTPVPESTLERARTWASQRFAGCVWSGRATAKNATGQLEGELTITLARHGGPRPELVVTRHARHASFIDILLERGVIDDTTPVLSQATRSAVKGKHVLGLLPNYLASLAASITEIPMRLTNEDFLAMQRGGLTPERARAVTGDPVTYRVERILDNGADQ
jgi:hypothetical protein